MFELKGTWLNTITNETVYPKDCIGEDGKMFVVLMNGKQIPMSKFQEECVQISDDEYDPNGVIKTNSNKVISNKVITNEIDILNQPIINTANYMMEDDINFLNKHNQPVAVSPSFNIIEKAFEKQGYKYEYEIKTLSEYPKKIHEFLREFTDVSDDELIDFIVTKYINFDTIKSAAETEIRRLFNLKINVESDIVDESAKQKKAKK